MSDASTLPKAVIVISPVPVSGHSRGDMITDAATIAVIYENNQQRSVVPVHESYAAEHSGRE